MKQTTLELLVSPVKVLEITPAIVTALLKIGVVSIWDLTQVTETGLRKAENIGAKSADKIMDGLESRGLSLCHNTQERVNYSIEQWRIATRRADKITVDLQESARECRILKAELTQVREHLTDIQYLIRNR